MPEYDAFGREVGEDPLDALREATVPAKPAPVAEPVVAEPVVAEPPVAAPPQFVRPRVRKRGGFAGLIVVAAVIGMVGLFGGAAVTRIESGLEDAVVTEEPAGLGPMSMLRAANLATALEQMRESGLGRPLSLRVAPSRVDAQLVAGNGRLSLVRVTPQQQLRTIRMRTGGRPAAGIAYAKIDVNVPERLARDADAESRSIRFVRLDRSGWQPSYRR